MNPPKATSQYMVLVGHCSQTNEKAKSIRGICSRAIRRNNPDSAIDVQMSKPAMLTTTDGHNHVQLLLRLTLDCRKVRLVVVRHHWRRPSLKVSVRKTMKGILAIITTEAALAVYCAAGQLAEGAAA
mmetsp:Transcript_2227/g.4690  ORF Transcript_2227/g.4690 Transcript_2227/m.4690 type:complete len:127 (-) Transcript_2227:118-498(-)